LGKFLFTVATGAPDARSAGLAHWRIHRLQTFVEEQLSQSIRLTDLSGVVGVDKLDGRIDSAFFDRMAAQWRDEQDRCLREVEQHTRTPTGPTFTRASTFSNSRNRPAACSIGSRRVKSGACSILWFRTALGRAAN
jgi:hypothetical protein